MNVLITGATGLVGNAIVDECYQNNIGVHYLTTTKSKIITTNKSKGFYWNPEKYEIDLNCFKDISAIINLAGASISKRWTPSYKKTILSSRINSLKTLHIGLSKVDSSDIKSFVSASAIGIYPSSLNKLYEEDDEINASDFLSEVVKSWEKEANTFKKFNFSVAKIRIGIVMSNKGGALPQMVRPINYYLGSPIGSGKQWQSWIHIKDLARMFLFVIENELKGVYNGVASNPVTNEKLTVKIADLLGKPIFLPNFPAPALKFILGEMAILVLNSQRVSNKKISGEGFVFDFQNVCPALESLYGKNGATI
tara:strand:- start:139 stop:1065 length:927 start_codon:yes stop_codon:yes gene_type:complete